MIRISLLCLFSFLCGCASNPDQLSTEASRVNGGGGLPIHGNFCGPSIPTTSGRTQTEQLKELARIPPQDRLDEQCKAHDMCYVRQTSRHSDCDVALINGVGALLERNNRANKSDGTANFTCDAVAIAVIGYFETANPSAVKNWTDKFVGNAMFQGAWGYTSAGLKVYQFIYVPLLTLYYPVMVAIGGFEEANKIYGKLWKSSWGGYADRWQICNF